MKRLGELDVPERLSPYLPPLASQILFALLCDAVAAAIRVAINAFAADAGPFALIYPAVLTATLLARWLSGFVALVIGVLAAWYFVLPFRNSFALADTTDGPRIAVIFLSNCLMIFIAEAFRQAVRHAVDERNAKLEERDLFLREVEHRVKNNFTVVASLLDLQRRRAKDEPTKAALGEALARVDSIARAHRHLYRFSGDVASVEMRDYLTELCDALNEALFLRGAIRIESKAVMAFLPRDRAVSVGLLVNELATNAAKHAFIGRESGRIIVKFSAAEGGYELVVADDGRGLPEDAEASQGLGRRLIEAFVMQANGELTVETGPDGTRHTLKLPN
ncbi:MAG: sensor histidine kinase [Hyphomonadaceae bacterium]